MIEAKDKIRYSLADLAKERKERVSRTQMSEEHQDKIQSVMDAEERALSDVLDAIEHESK